MHRRGLRGIADTRGGYRAFHTDWRLQLVISLYAPAISINYLLSVPDLIIRLGSIRAPEQSPSVAYLLQGYENLVFELLGVFYFTHESSKRLENLNRLQDFVSLTEVMNTLRDRRKVEEKTFTNTLSGTEAAFQHLKSLLFIWASLQESDERTKNDPEQRKKNTLTDLDAFLKNSRRVWICSENDVLAIIWDDFSQRMENRQIAQFVTMVAESLKGNGPKAMWGLEQCLLNYWS